MKEITNFLEVLINGKWHKLEEIIQKTGLDKHKAELILDFLKKYSFIEFDEQLKQVKASRALLNFLREIM